MTLSDYQRLVVARTYDAPFPERERRMVMALGLCGEAGEVAERVKKESWHGKPVDLDAMALELGDCLWYLGALATAYGLDLDAIADKNRAKLEARYPAGFEVRGGRTGTESRRAEP